ncbi:hypothetical protein ACIO13_20815 [Streptomyces sp. NPDC087425]|uniref:hypothetical protein n=1 Tax=unclassified Streptomyces TaxID=2593676 RepID=UPI0037FC8DC0
MEQLAAHAPRFASGAQLEAGRLARLAATVAQRLDSGGDATVGFYLERPIYLSLALVTCSPNRSRPHLPCPRAR